MVGLLAIWLFLSFLVAPVFAQGNIHLGRLKVEPGIAYKFEYNDNIYSANTDEEEDYIHTVTPSIRLGYTGTAGNFFSAGYNVELVAYSDYDKNNYQNHRPFISLGYKSPAGLYLRANDYFQHTEDPYGTENQYGIGRKTKRWNNTADVAAGYDLTERYTLECMYKNYVERFDLTEDKWQNRIDHVYGASFFVRVTGKTSLFGQYRRTQAEYDEQNDGIDGWNSTNSRDYNLNDYFIGARFEPGGKLSGEIKLGYGEQEFDNAIDKDGNPYVDESSWVAETTVNYQPMKKTRLSLNLQRSFKGAPDVDSSSYEDTLVGLTLGQELGNRFSLDLGFEWNKNDYLNENPGRPEKYFDIYTFKGALDYRIQDWLTAGLEYKYKSKQASHTEYKDSEYDNNVIGVRLSAMF